MSTAQIAVAVYGSGWAAYSTYRAWPQQCRKIAADIWQGLTGFFQRAAIFDSGPSCSCGSAWHRSEFKHATERREQTRQIRARLDEVHRINERAEIMWNNSVNHAPLPGSGGGSGSITVGGVTGISRKTHPDPRLMLVPGSERKTLEYEYRTLYDSNATDDRGFYRTVTQRRLLDSPGATWEDGGFAYCPPPKPSGMTGDDFIYGRPDGLDWSV